MVLYWSLTCQRKTWALQLTVSWSFKPTCLDEVTVPRLFSDMVRTHLEYGNVIWSPRYQSESKEVNKIQRRPTKLVPNLRSLPYKERLSSLKLPSLMHRRQHGDMIQYVYNFMNSMDRIEPGLFFQRPQHTGTRGHSQKIYSILGLMCKAHSSAKEL